VLTLVSKDECEIAEGGTTLLCKYTKQDGKLRVVTTALGTSQVLYFRFTEQGLDDNKGTVLFSPEALAVAMRQIRREEERIAKEQERIAEEKLSSTNETQEISTFSLLPAEGGPDKLVLTDVSLKLHYLSKYDGNGIENNTLWLFAKIAEIGDVGKWHYDQFTVKYYPLDKYTYYTYVLYCASKDEAQAVHDSVLKAYNAWKTKFPEAVFK
jgi:hypothetical protein